MNTQHQPTTLKAAFREINVLYLALIGGQLILFVVLYFFVIPQDDGNNESIAGGFDPMVLAGILVFVTLASASFFMYNKRKTEGVQLGGSLMEKLEHYKASFILRAALLEGPNLLLLMCYFFMQKNIVFLILFAIGMALFFRIRPTVDQFTQDYQLSGSEQSELRNSIL